MELHVKTALEGEFELILSLLHEAAAVMKNKGIDQWKIWLAPDDDNLLWVKSGLQNREFYIIKGDNASTIGMYRLSYEDERYWGKQTAPCGYLHSLVVRQPFSGNGIGKKIIAMVEDLLIKQGYNRLRLDCNAANAWLCSYYNSQGFVQVGQKQMPHSLNNLYEKILVGNADA